MVERAGWGEKECSERPDLRECKKFLSPSSLILLRCPYFSRNGAHLLPSFKCFKVWQTISILLSLWQGALGSFSFTLLLFGWVSPFHQGLLFMITLSKRQKIEIYFNNCRELSFLRALSLETWRRLHWQKSFSPELSSGVTCCCLRLWGEETPPHPSALIAWYHCNWFGFCFLTVVKAIDVIDWIGRIGSFPHSVSQQRHQA